MAIAKVKHVDIFFTKDLQYTIPALIQKQGSVHLIQLRESGFSPQAIDDSATESSKIQETLHYLESLYKSKLERKIAIKEEQMQLVRKKCDLESILQKLNTLRNRLKIIEIEQERVQNEKSYLYPWESLTCALEDIRETPYTVSMIGVMNAKRLKALQESTEREKLSIYIDIVSRKEHQVYIFIVFTKDEASRAWSLLKKYEFYQIGVPDLQGPPRQILAVLNEESVQLKAQKAQVMKEILLLIPERQNLMVLSDILSNEKTVKAVSAELFQTDYVRVLSGWVKEKDISRVKAVISAYPDVEILIREPKPDEEVPVDLDNMSLIRPFEFLTRIYGMPKYNELDPTPFLAPFFFLYFGFCVSDVGYGVILALFCLYAMKKFHLGVNGKLFFRLFLFGAISTIIAGALTGSCFGNLIDLVAENHTSLAPLKAFKDKMVILDPMREPTKLLGIMLSFGICQVWFGTIVAAIGNIKNKRYADILFDQVTMLIFLVGFTGLAFIFLHILSPDKLVLFKFCVLAGALGLVLTQGRSEKTLGSKLFYGVYNLYMAVSGYLSDILSYSRLWALGLVTGVMATTINLISREFSKIISSSIPVVNKIEIAKNIIAAVVLVSIFVAGHLVSFMMNLLGAFVHPLRLQFVEFFSKFFRPGGNPFIPFKRTTKYIEITND